MATIREVVEALSRGPGVDAVVVVGRDGLPIQSHARNGVDPENVAALLPSVINGMTQLGEAAGRGVCGSGLNLLRALRRATATRTLPVIVLTAEGEERILDEAQGLGSALLTKPFSPTKLIARIAALLGDSPPHPPPQPLGESA